MTVVQASLFTKLWFCFDFFVFVGIAVIQAQGLKDKSVLCFNLETYPKEDSMYQCLA